MTNLPLLILRDAVECLRYSRSHAKSFSQALYSWQSGQLTRLQRMRRLAKSQAALLLQAEQACRHAGLFLGGSGQGRCAPWHLDEALLDAPLASLPVHPLIDWLWLAEQWKADAHEMCALQGLQRLLAAAGTQQKPSPGTQTSLTCTMPPTQIAVCLHLYYPDTWSEFEAAFAEIPEAFDLFVTVPDFAATPVLDRIVNQWPRTKVLRYPNRGRDVLPFLRLLADGYLDSYDWVCKLHSKKSPHMSDGSVWRQRLLDSLLGPRKRVESLLWRLRAESTWGLWAPPEHWIEPGHAKWLGTNAGAMQRLQRLTGLSAQPVRPPYIAGTMFWVRTDTLVRLRQLGSQPEAFESEFGQTDGTLAHAVERGLALDVCASKYQLSSSEF